MKQDGRHLSKDQKAFIRRMAVERVLQGESASAVIKSYGLCRTTIYKWLRIAKTQGIEALGPTVSSGRARTLTAEQEEEVKHWIVGKDPRQYDLEYALWTREIVASLIERFFGIQLSVTSVGRLLHRIGLSPQKPLRRAYERDQAAIDHWLEVEYPKIKKQAKRAGAEIFWLDEAGVRSDDALQRTWGLKGQTPVVQTSGQRQSLNLISAVNNQGKFWYSVYSGRFNSQKFIELLKQFRRGRRNPVVLIMDGHPVHKSKEVLSYIDSLGGELRLVYLPPYAPDMNPDELVWNQLRHEGPTKKPLKKGESLKTRIVDLMESLKSNKALIRSFFNEQSVAFAKN